MSGEGPTAPAESASIGLLSRRPSVDPAQIASGANVAVLAPSTLDCSAWNRPRPADSFGIDRQGTMTADLARLFEEYYPSLVRMLYRRTGDRDRAEDLAQETFARAVAAPPDNPRPWLFAVALNLVREDGRKTVTRGRRLELLRTEQDRPAAGPDTDLERNEDVARVRSALARLNERDREALLLKAEGFGYDEIASTLGLAKGAVGTTLARARRRLVEAYRAQDRGNNVAS
jgi:RNA polymerase sigma-70 factor, ECF subfamily